MNEEDLDSVFSIFIFLLGFWQVELWGGSESLGRETQRFWSFGDDVEEHGAMEDLLLRCVEPLTVLGLGELR